MSKINKRPERPKVFTFEGAQASHLTPAQELRRSVMASFLWEDAFYESGEDHAARVKALVPLCSFKELEEIVVQARTVNQLRSIPLYILREMLRHKHLHQGLAALIAKVVLRADEMGNLLALYWKDQPNAPLAYQLKKGLAAVYPSFHPERLAKYNGRDQAVRPRDVMFMVHPRPFLTDFNRDLYEKAPAIVKGNYKRGEVKRHVNNYYGAVAADSLESPDTWEVRLSAGANKKEAFEDLLRAAKLGGLALLRNLRGMLVAGVDEVLIRTAIQTNSFDRVLPFRFLTAAQHAPSLSDALEQAFFRVCATADKLKGFTTVVVDNSGSMYGSKVSEKSELDRSDAACALAMIAREVCEKVRIVVFANAPAVAMPTHYRGFALVKAIKSATSHGGTETGQAVEAANMLLIKEPASESRVIVITDEQSHTALPLPFGRGYVVNVGTYNRSIAYGPWVSITGWSEGVLKYISAFEQG